MSQKELTGNDTEKLHFFTHSTDGITLPSVFTYPFHYTPHPLTQLAAREVQAYLSERKEWEEELHQGKCSEYWWSVPRITGQDTWLPSPGIWQAVIHTRSLYLPYTTCCSPMVFRLEEAQISQINTRIRELEQASEYQSQKKSYWTYRKPATGN